MNPSKKDTIGTAESVFIKEVPHFRGSFVH